MPTSTFTNCRLAIGVILILLLHRSTAFFSIPKAKNPSQKPELDHSTDLTALIRQTPEDQSGVYTHALQILSSFQASPSCHRLAASTLLDSCHSIDGSKHDATASLEHSRSIYAAQLAMCEIASAEATIPQSCSSLALISEPKSYRTLSSKSVRKDQLSQCLQALEARPQWWTSYSNSRQNAVVMCQAARVDIEKDELIELHKSMIVASSDANSALARASDQANYAVIQLQNDFALAKQGFQDQLVHDLEASTAKTQTLLERLVKSMDTAVQSAMSKMVSATKDIESGTARLSQNVLQANKDSVELDKSIAKVFQRVVEGGADLAATQTKQWDQSRDLAIELQGSLRNFRDSEVSALMGLFHGIHDQVTNSHEMVSSLIVRQNALDERFVNLDKSFAIIQETADKFSAAQDRQAELQTRHNENMLVDMQTTRGVLDDVTSSAATLAPIAFAFAWIRPLSLLAFPLLVLSCFSRRYALFAGLGIAFVFAVFDVLKSTSFTANSHRYIWENKILHEPLVRAAAVFLLILALGAGSYRANCLRIVRRYKPHTASTLYQLGLEAAERKHTSWSV